QAQEYSNDLLPRARGAAARQMEDAEAYRARTIADAEGESDRFTKILHEYARAPDVTRRRIYLETLEEILANSTKVLVDTEGGNNMLYLPLDQLMQQRRSAPVTEQAPATPIPTSNLPNARASRERAFR